MRIPSTFGQYVPVESWVHALDARTKMALVAGFTALLFWPTASQDSHVLRRCWFWRFAYHTCRGASRSGEFGRSCSSC